MEQLIAKARELDMDEVRASVAERGRSVPSGVREPSGFTGRQSARRSAAMRSSPDANMKMGGMATVASRGPLLRPGRGLAGHSLYPHGYSEPMRPEVARWRITGGCLPEQRGLA